MDFHLQRKIALKIKLFMEKLQTILREVIHLHLILIIIYKVQVIICIFFFFQKLCFISFIFKIKNVEVE